MELPTSIHHIRLSVLLLIARVFSAIFIINTIYGLILFFFVWSDTGILIKSTLTSLWLGHIIIFIIQTIVVINIIANWARTNYYLTAKELVVTKGIITERSFAYGLSSIRSVIVYQSWFGRLLNYGSVILTMSASGGYHEEIKLLGIKNPKNYEHALRSNIYPDQKIN